MVDIWSRKCRTEGRGKIPSFGVAGTKTSEYCARHAPDEMVNVCGRKSRTEGCGKRPLFRVAATQTVEYCARHAADACSRKFRTGGCGKKPSFGVAATQTAKYCAQHARIQRGVEGYSEREVGPHHSGKETISNVIPSGAKHVAVLLPPTKTSHPSSVSRDSRKRVLHPKITSTTSKRSVTRESTAGAGILPDVERRKPPVRQNSCVKTELQLS